MGFWDKIKSIFSIQTEEPEYTGKRNGHFIFDDMNVEFDILEKYEVKNIRHNERNEYYLDVLTKHGGKITITIRKTNDYEFENLTNKRGKKCVCADLGKKDIRYAEFKIMSWDSPSSVSNEVVLYVKAKDTLIISRYYEDAINSFAYDQYAMEVSSYYGDPDYIPPTFEPPNKADIEKEGECSYFNYSLRNSIKIIE